MKKIVEGKSYNTETAEDVASFGNGLGRGDFSSYDETLYRTKKGAWFLAGEGGPMTKYSRPCSNMTSGGSDIFVLTPSEAQKWLENHDETDAIAKHFTVEEA